MRILTTLLFCFFAFNLLAQEENFNIERVEPPFWWTKMNNPEVQLLVYGNNIGTTEASLDYQGLELIKSQKVENPNYLFLTLRMEENCEPGIVNIQFTREDKSVAAWDYELLERKAGSAKRKGYDRTDALYLLMPDRFANGDPSNDNVPGMLEKANRENPDGRHGGDIKGIIEHLDYIVETGFTGIWINPLVENNNPDFSYHGYAATDFYKIDARYGTLEDYINLINISHEKGLKIIMDVIFNHCSVHHWFIKDLPSEDWIHQHEQFERSNFRAPTIMDPYASEYDRTKMLTGWFDHVMADLDQRNPLVSAYLIQNTIWWIEFSGIDGIRVDTQPYPYKEFMSDWGKAVFAEYPDFNVVGEAWLQKEAMTAYFQAGSPNPDGYNSHLPSVTDFPVHGALNNAFNEEDTWTDGLLRLYYVLAHDYLYGDPFENLIFVDNHDVDRYFTAVKNDLNKWKMGMIALATLRGIPCVYYGTEILMDGRKDDGHGQIRKDFPGGWEGDTIQVFNMQGLTAEEKEAYTFLKKLYTWRKDQSVIHTGQFKHFIPEDNTYVYFRYNEDRCIMVALNNSEKELKALDHKRFKECLTGYTVGIDVMTGNPINYLEAFTIPPKSALLIELKK
jgi:glycosidase